MTHITLFLINEQRLPHHLDGLPDQEKFERLVKAVETYGKPHTELNIRVESFARCLEAIDFELGSTGFLPVFAFNHSPHNLLGDDSECPSFGYFSPSQVTDLYISLSELPEDVVTKLTTQRGYTQERIFKAFLSASGEADRRGLALAVIHS